MGGEGHDAHLEGRGQLPGVTFSPVCQLDP